MEDKTLIGYLSLERNEERKSFLGALLVVDTMSRPIEFRVTFPVRPTAIQQPLYGDALEPYIGVELCGKQLIDALDNEASLILVSEEFLLELRSYFKKAILLVMRSGDVIEVSSDEGEEKIKSRITSASGRFQPINIYSANTHPEDISDSQEIMESFFEDTDVLEPFERIKVAVETLILQDDRFSI